MIVSENLNPKSGFKISNLNMISSDDDLFNLKNFDLRYLLESLSIWSSKLLKNRYIHRLQLWQNFVQTYQPVLLTVFYHLLDVLTLSGLVLQKDNTFKINPDNFKESIDIEVLSQNLHK